MSRVLFEKQLINNGPKEIPGMEINLAAAALDLCSSYL